MNPLPEINKNSESIWLDLLNDNELDAFQRRELYEYLDDSHEGWKRCAKLLLHERQLAAELSQAFGSDSIGAARNDAIKPVLESQRQGAGTTGRLPASMLLAALAICLAFVLGTFVNQLWEAGEPTPNAATDALDHNDRVQGFETPISLVANHLVDSHTIYEVQNTATSATYYLEKPVPDFFLQALVLAGHAVEVDQEFVDIVGPDGEYFPVPINKLEINKFALK